MESIRTAYYATRKNKKHKRIYQGIYASSGCIVILNLRDRRKRYLHDLAIRTFHLDAGCGEGLGGLHTFDCTSHSLAVCSNDLDIILAV